MTGSVGVQSVSNDFYRIQNFKVLTAGSTKATVGNVDVSGSTGAVIYSRISAVATRARNITWTVPKNKKLFIEEANFGCVHTAANKHTIMTLRANYDLVDAVSASVFYPISMVVMSDGTQTIPYVKPLGYPTGTDITVTASSNGTAIVTVGLRGYTAPTS